MQLEMRELAFTKNRPLCSIIGCHNLAKKDVHGRFKPLCAKHHNQKYHMPNGSKERKRSKLAGKYNYVNSLTNEAVRNKCDICGREGVCERHRLEPGMIGGQYSRANVIFVCKSCHRLIHAIGCSRELVKTYLLEKEKPG